MIDDRPRQPVSLRLSVTDRCQLRCRYCMPPQGIPAGPRGDLLTFEEILRFVRMLGSHVGLGKVRVTGGEPLLRSDVVRLVEMLSREGIEDLAITTNAQRLADMAPALKRAGLRRVNVSLDSLDAETYARLTRGGKLHAALAGIEAAVRCGLTPVKINTVLLRGYNTGEVTALARWAIERGCTLRFLELMPIGRARDVHDELFAPVSVAYGALARAFDLTPLARLAGETSRDYMVRQGGLRGTIGFVTSVSHPFCAGCRRLRLTSTGRLIACLARGEGEDVRALLRSPSPDGMRSLEALVDARLREKSLRGTFDTVGSMAAIGG